MRKLNEFKVVLATDSGEIYTATKENIQFTAMDVSFEAAYVPLKLSWKNSAEVYEFPLNTEVNDRDRGMGKETIVYGNIDFSVPDSDKIANVIFEFREYPRHSYDSFELELTENVSHPTDYTNLRQEVRNRV